MRIEVAVLNGLPNKEKGDLLEAWARRLVSARGYDVVEQVRKTASELDLLCSHPESGERVYVECKAHADPLSAPVLHQILGKLSFDEGLHRAWLVSAGPLGKDAKGFMDDWERKPQEKRGRLLILTPDRVVAAFVKAGIVCNPPEHDACMPDMDHQGTWVLLLCPDGPFWVMPVLAGGIPRQVLVFHARTGARATAKQTQMFSNLDWSLGGLALLLEDEPQCAVPSESEAAAVIPVAVGDQWRDYRPARPEDFVGRKDLQDRVLDLMDSVAARHTHTRVFALLGDSGMGKSSLIVKLRNRFQNKRHRGRLFMFAVDVRAARSQAYPYAALVSCIARASESFGYTDLPAPKIEDQALPLGGESIQSHLAAYERDGRVVCLVFDQFEELYSKPGLYPVFEAMQGLLLDVVGSQSSLVLGFAWKTDATVHQDHPAYHMWHRLADHRRELTLRPLDAADTLAAVTKFQKELREKLNPALRRQVTETSRGLPWLLKILCIHLLEQLEAGKSQLELLDGALDAKTLFDRQLQSLSGPETSCLRMIAATAPADWYEVIEAYGADVLRGLIDRRLVVKSGERVAVYWDIFREYLLTASVPHVPVTYLPASPSLHALLALAAQLHVEHPRPTSELAGVAGVAPNTAANIVRDLVMLGVATRQGDTARLAEGIGEGEEAVLDRLRDALKRHALMAEVRRLPVGTTVTRDDVVGMLKVINPAAHHRRQTWEMYADRLLHWLVVTGFLRQQPGGGWRWDDLGRVNLDAVGLRRRPQGAIAAAAPPEATVEAVGWLADQLQVTSATAEGAGYRNAMQVLGSLGLLVAAPEGYVLKVDLQRPLGAAVVVWEAARADPLLSHLRAWRSADPARRSGEDLGVEAARFLGTKWSKGSLSRHGNALMRWCEWLDNECTAVPPPFPAKRRGKRTHREASSKSESQGSLFDLPLKHDG